MKFGIRECTNVVFRAKSTQTIGTQTFAKGQPVLYIDSAKTSTLEGAATSVYATGGRGNARLITWEGEKTLTFTVEDALLSPLGFSILSGAGLFNAESQPVHVNQVVKATIAGNVGTETRSYYLKQHDETEDTYSYVLLTEAAVTPAIVTTAVEWTESTLPNQAINVTAESPGAVVVVSGDPANYYVDLTDEYGAGTQTIIDKDAPIFISYVSEDSLTNILFKVGDITSDITDGKIPVTSVFTYNDKGQEVTYSSTLLRAGTIVMANFYIKKMEDTAMELQIDAENFAGTYYVEADTLVRKQSNGKDIPAILTIPNVKIQSNFSITMASSGDPSTFTFTMDAMPGYTYFNKKNKVLCVLQLINEEQSVSDRDAVMRHDKSGETKYTHSVDDD